MQQRKTGKIVIPADAAIDFGEVSLYLRIVCEPVSMNGFRRFLGSKSEFKYGLKGVFRFSQLAIEGFKKFVTESN